MPDVPLSVTIFPGLGASYDYQSFAEGCSAPVARTGQADMPRYPGCWMVAAWADRRLDVRRTGLPAAAACSPGLLAPGNVAAMAAVAGASREGYGAPAGPGASGGPGACCELAAIPGCCVAACSGRSC
jgi:hypothetical protein